MSGPIDAPGTRRRSGFWTGWVLVVWLSIGIPALFVPPANDDWEFGNPILHPSVSNFLPLRTQWRPVDTVIRIGMGLAPATFPLLNHVLVVTAHGLSALLLVAVLRRWGAGDAARGFAASFFLISPAVCATVFSVDSINQAWALAFGLMSLWALLAWSGRARVTGWILFAYLATFAKESGLAFFVVAPMLADATSAGMRDRHLKEWRPSRELIRMLLAGAACAAIYLGLRLLLSGGLDLGTASGKYQFQLSPVVWLRNLGWLIGFSAVTVDTLAIFVPPASPARTIATLAAGLPLLAVAAAAGRSRMGRIGYGACLLAACLVALPHVVIEYPGEMNAYPTVAMLALCLGMALNDPTPRQKRMAAFALTLFLMVSWTVDRAKWLAMFNYGKSAEAVAAIIDQETRGARPRTVCLVGSKGAEPSGYSVFTQSPEWASGWGRAVLPRWQWRAPERFVECELDGRCPIPCDSTWTFPGQGRVRVLARPETSGPPGR